MRMSSLALVLAVLPAHVVAQVPAGGEFQVNTYTTDRQVGSSVAVHSSGQFTVTWASSGQGSYFGVYAQRYGEDGAPSGGEFQVNVGTATTASLPAVAHARTGSSFIAWSDAGLLPFDIHARRYARDGTARGGPFQVNTYTTGTQYKPDVAPLPGGGFVVAWSSSTDMPRRVMLQRYDAFGVPMGAETQASGAGEAAHPAIASDAQGGFAVVWQEFLGSCCGIFGRIFDPAGNAVGSQFTVMPQGAGTLPDVAMDATGGFVVAWGRPMNGPGIGARRFSPTGAPIGTDFSVNTTASGQHHLPSIAMDRGGEFVVAWSRRTATAYDVIARRFDATAAPRSGDFMVNSFTTNHQYLDEVASDGVGNFVVTWTSEGQDGHDFGVFGQRFGGLLPAALAVDTVATAQSDGNGVLEPGESVAVVPSWRNVTTAAQAFTGAMTSFGGPPGATYSIVDAAGSYGAVPAGITSPCSDCYAVSVSAPPARPSPHWDTIAREELAPDIQGQKKSWLLHVGDTFTDVPRSSPFYRFVETLVHHNVAGGCSASTYCPADFISREQMAVFVVVARDQAGDPPPPCTTPMFSDVPASSPYCRFIEELARSGAVTGCGSGNFCPAAHVTREQVAVFVLRALDPSLNPPACGTPMFADVPASSPFCPWIEELTRRGVVTGCGGGNYCPASPVTREQMGVFISVTFGLTLYGP